MFGSALQGTMAQLVEEAPITAEDIEDAVAATDVEFAGGITPSGGITGVADDSVAAAGEVGEVISAAAAVDSVGSWSTNTAKNITSISLTAGDWDVVGSVTWKDSTTGTYYAMSVTTTSATLLADGAAPGRVDTPYVITSNSYLTQVSVPTRFSLAAPATVYLVGQLGFTAGTPKAGGTIRARRVR